MIFGESVSPVASTTAVAPAPTSAAATPAAPASIAATAAAFVRPPEASPHFRPSHGLQTGFVPSIQAFPQTMQVRWMRPPTGLQQVGTGAQEPVAAPDAAASATAQPPSAAKIKAHGHHMLPIPLRMALGLIPTPRAGGVRAGLDPSRMVARGRKPGL